MKFTICALIGLTSAQLHDEQLMFLQTIQMSNQQKLAQYAGDIAGPEDLYNIGLEL